MRTARLSVHHHPIWMVVVFVAALVASFFALGTVAGACVNEVVIHKTEIGAAAPGDSYTFVMTGDEFRREVVVDAGASTVIAGVPPGTYWFEEVGAPSGATIEPNPITIESRSYDQTVDVYATNPYLAGRLAITKVTTGSTAPAGPYTFDITGPQTFTAQVATGETWTSDWLPLGTYTITERDAPTGATIAPNPVVLDTDGQTVTVTATNPYRDTHAKLEIVKVTTGSAAPAGPYTFDITGPVTFTAQVATGETWTSDWLPLGTYTITERDAPTGATIAPNPVVLDTDGQTVTVTATNPYRDTHAKLEIVKVFAGGGSNPAGPWTIDVTGPVTFTAQIATGETWTSDWLPLGTYTVTERDAPTGATIAPNPVVLDTDGQTVRVVVTNPAVESEGATTTTTPPATTAPPSTLPATGVGTASGTVAPLAMIMLLSGTALVGAVRIRTRHPA
jgi:uncharacterized surface anchored protein